MGAQPCLHMSDGYLLVEGCQGCGRTGCGVSMYQHNVWLRLFQYVTHACQHAGCHVIEVLTLLHDVQVVVGLYVKDAQHLVEHLAVLTRHANLCLKVGVVFLKGFHQWSHLDGFRPGAED